MQRTPEQETLGMKVLDLLIIGVPSTLILIGYLAYHHALPWQRC